VFKTQQGTGGNFKSMLCKYYQNGFCKNEANCTFAHGEQELQGVQFSPIALIILERAAGTTAGPTTGGPAATAEDSGHVPDRLQSPQHRAH